MLSTPIGCEGGRQSKTPEIRGSRESGREGGAWIMSGEGPGVQTEQLVGSQGELRSLGGF